MKMDKAAFSEMLRQRRHFGAQLERLYALRDKVREFQNALSWEQEITFGGYRPIPGFDGEICAIQDKLNALYDHISFELYKTEKADAEYVQAVEDDE